MIDTCQPSWTNKNIKQKCEEDSDELLTILPVTDGVRKTIYKNVFCAVCNQATNVTYWKIEISKTIVEKAGNQTLGDILAQTTKWKFVNHYTEHTRYCMPKHPGCRNESSLAHLVRMSSRELQTVCNSYSFPVEVKHTCSKKESYRNLHCMLCAGVTYKDDCYFNFKPFAPQTIAFDFIAQGSQTSPPYDPHSTRVKRYSCNAASFYNPFTDQCQTLNEENTVNNKTNVSTHVEIKVHKIFRNSCMELSGNSSQNASVLSNGSLIINGKIRHDMKLKVIDNSSYICWTDTQSSTSRGHPEKDPSKSVLEVISAVGFVLSSTCLLFLLVTYSIYPELRTTPGKCVMSLSCALLLYMVCHVPITSTSHPDLCVGNAIVFHYSVLSVFTWLSVFAFDISKRFGGQG